MVGKGSVRFKPSGLIVSATPCVKKAEVFEKKGICRIRSLNRSLYLAFLLHSPPEP